MLILLYNHPFCAGLHRCVKDRLPNHLAEADRTEFKHAGIFLHLLGLNADQLKEVLGIRSLKP